MDISTALLADFAQVREGMLFVASGGVNRSWRPEYPAPLNLALALVIEFDQIESRNSHDLQVLLLGEDGEQVAEVRGAVQIGIGEDAEFGDNIAVPIALDLRGVGLPKPGRYEVRIYVDGSHQRTLGLKATVRTEDDL